MIILIVLFYMGVCNYIFSNQMHVYVNILLRFVNIINE